MGITPIERLKLRAGDYRDARERTKRSGIGLIHPWAVVLGGLLILVGMFMANYGLNDWLDFPAMFAGIALVFFGYRQGDE